MYTIYFDGWNYGCVSTMRRAREIAAELRGKGHTVEWWYVPNIDQEFLPGY